MSNSKCVRFLVLGAFLSICIVTNAKAVSTAFSEPTVSVVGRPPILGNIPGAVVVDTNGNGANDIGDTVSVQLSASDADGDPVTGFSLRWFVGESEVKTEDVVAVDNSATINISLTSEIFVAGETLKVSIITKTDENNTEPSSSWTANPVPLITLAQPNTVVSAAINGEAIIGNTLTVEPVCASVDGDSSCVVKSYEWLIGDGDDVSTYQPLKLSNEDPVTTASIDLNQTLYLQSLQKHQLAVKVTSDGAGDKIFILK
ncbi:hypothetical protein [Aeromonas sp. JL9]|uniref:hypothetical protein n=1 Tax=Aeromonas sp. JL9 TaxID=2950549 RepID=UPI00210C1116|nr:hypothetical protein [Aeromonas sp. JL9]MCQ4111553.1 hypothetical protein [Aeromonas sp. JL9]